MTFLTICQDVHREIAGGSSDPGTLPTAVTGQEKQLARIVTWVNRAYREIQESQRDWRWMMDEAIGEETITVGSNSVTLLGDNTDFDELRPYMDGDTPYILVYKDSVGVTDSQPVWLRPLSEFNGFYDSGRFGDSSGRPRDCAINADGALRFFPKADVVYRLKYKYRKTVQNLAANGDNPLMPAKYHDMIMHLALCYYARSTEATRILDWLGTGLQDRSRPNSPLTQLYQSLCNEQLPEVSWFGER